MQTTRSSNTSTLAIFITFICSHRSQCHGTSYQVYCSLLPGMSVCPFYNHVKCLPGCPSLYFFYFLSFLSLLSRSFYGTILLSFIYTRYCLFLYIHPHAHTHSPFKTIPPLPQLIPSYFMCPRPLFIPSTHIRMLLIPSEYRKWFLNYFLRRSPLHMAHRSV
ncbi:hypothetical protein DFH27DRAFT_302218 [Peziza echinospora]|nr:hypothetical protein DFH27DRAFT_302218 [Peziza echinospora]